MSASEQDTGHPVGKRHEVAILMSAGLGSRMRPLTDTLAKPLVPVLGRPLIETVIIENPEYCTKNNIGSIAVAAEQMASADCFVCEADLFVPSENLLCRPLEPSGYFGKFLPGHSDDWVFETSAGRITRIGQGGDDCFNMVGISFFRQPDAERVALAVQEAAKYPENAQLFWDDVVDRLVKNGLDLTIHEIHPGEIVECDTVQDLKNLEEGLRL